MDINENSSVGGREALSLSKIFAFFLFLIVILFFIPRRSRNSSGERSDHWTDSDNAWSRDRDGRGGGGRKSGESGRGRNGNDRNSDEGSRGDRNKRDTSRGERNNDDHSSEKRAGDNNNRGRKHNDNSSSGNGNSNSNGNGNGSGSGRVQETRTTNLERSKPTTDTSRNPFLIKSSQGPRSGTFGFGHKGPSDPGSGDRNGVRGTTGGKTICTYFSLIDILLVPNISFFCCAFRLYFTQRSSFMCFVTRRCTYFFLQN